MRWFELVEIPDEGPARNHMMSLRTAAITGGAFSQRAPLERSIKSKAGKSYDTAGARLDLLAYYDTQCSADSVEPELIPETIGPVAAEMIASGTWSRVWVYDSWNRRVLWSYPENESGVSAG